MEDLSKKILLIEDNSGDAHLVRQMLEWGEGETYGVDITSSLSDGIALLGVKTYDALLVDLKLPDSEGIKTFEAVRNRAPNIPIILLTGTDDEVLASELVSKGAQDYLPKADVSRKLLLRSIRYSIERKQVESQIRHLATVDSLTGAYVRRHFFELGNKELSRCRRHNAVFSVLMIDIDHFKKINDTFGHAAGDVVLTTMSKLLGQALRESDFVGRLGGEEFAVILPETPLEGAMQVGARILESFATSPVNAGDKTIKFTASAGATMWKDSDQSLDETIRRADNALYQAKNAGRNRIISCMDDHQAKK